MYPTPYILYTDIPYIILYPVTGAPCPQVGTVMVRWVGKYVDPVMATGWHMILGGLPLLALAVQREGADLLPRLGELTGAPLQATRPPWAPM